MSLFLQERINEPQKDKIVFTLPIIRELDVNDNFIDASFTTCYEMGSAMWTLSLIENEIQITTFCDMFPEIKRFQNGNCFVSYTLFYDTDMRFVFYSSLRIQMNKSEDSFSTPDGYMEKYGQALAEGKVSKIVMHFELHLPLKYFLRPFDDPSSYLSKGCKGYPKDPKTDYKFAFLNQSDYIIKCQDGSVSAVKSIVNISCLAEFRNIMDALDEEFLVLNPIDPTATVSCLTENIRLMKATEIVVDHSVDVVKPYITFLHTLCFEMPKCYDLDFVKRLFKVIDFFKPLQKKLIVNSIEKSLCENILRHVYDLHSALQWIHVALQKKLVEFRRMLCSLIANKYFYKLIEMYPENTRNPDNPIFHEIFGQYSESFFRQICMIFVESFFTNVILE